MTVNFLILALALAYFTDISEGFVPWTASKAGNDTIFIRGKHFSRAPAPAPEGTPAQIFNQCMDWTQSDPCAQTWSQRYWVNSNYYQSGGPIFYMLGAEGPADGAVDGGEWLYYAAQYGALMVAIEHRFYGQSIPTTQQTLSALALLTSQQALADYANFIPSFQSQQGLPTTTPVVAFGGSYGGNLAAWFREKYPNVVNVAVASSGPVQATFDFSGYLQTISQVISENNQECFTQIYNAYNCMQELIQNNQCSGTSVSVNQLSSALYECYNYDLSDPTSVQYFFKTQIFDDWASNYPWTTGESKCSALNQDNGATGDVINDYGTYLENSGDSGVCPNGPTTGSSNGKRSLTSSASVNAAKRSLGLGDGTLDFINSDAGATVGAAGWFWQTCNEFGYFQTTDPVYQLFGTDVSTDTYVEECQSQYGEQFTADFIQQNIANTNNYYYGQQNNGTCIIFVSGSYDPWHTLGIYNSSQTSSQNSVVFIPMGEHCEDMEPNLPKPYTVAAQAQIQTLIGQYLQNPNCT